MYVHYYICIALNDMVIAHHVYGQIKLNIILIFNAMLYSLFFSFSGAGVAKPFGERIVVDFQLSNLRK